MEWLKKSKLKQLTALLRLSNGKLIQVAFRYDRGMTLAAGNPISIKDE